MNHDQARGKGAWKLNNLLALNSDFADKMKAHIANTLKNLDKENIRNDQARWEYLKYEIRKFSIKFSKLFSKHAKTETVLLEKNWNCYNSLQIILIIPNTFLAKVN